MQGIPMVASSPVRHESPLGMNPIEVHSYQPPWKALSDFALHTDLDRLDPTAPPFQQLVNQVSTFFIKKLLLYDQFSKMFTTSF
jgi:insulin gene enhancer protein ISL-1